ncbi:MAG: DUF3810 domain-containing protein [Blastocatellia bacterium]
MRIDHDIKIQAGRAAQQSASSAVTERKALRQMSAGYAAIALLLVTVALQLLAGYNPRLVEHYYSRGFYPYVAAALAFINRRVSFSIAEMLLMLLAGGALCWLAVQVRRVLKKQVVWRQWLFAAMVRLLMVVSVSALTFLLLWGLNYQRQPLAQNFEFTSRKASADELEAISRVIVMKVNESYLEAARDHDWPDHSRIPHDPAQLAQLIEEAYQQEPLLKGIAPTQGAPPKPVMFSRLMTIFGITGVYNPFTGEPNYNTEQPDFELPYTIAHEKAHQRGFAQEDEASFIAFLVCIRSSDAYVRYSGYMHALGVLRRFGSALLRESLPILRYKAVYDQLGQGPRADLAASSTFWRRYQGHLMTVGERVNDTYLKANRVTHGTVSYSGVDGLIISYYLKYQH